MLRVRRTGLFAELRPLIKAECLRVQRTTARVQTGTFLAGAQITLAHTPRRSKYCPEHEAHI